MGREGGKKEKSGGGESHKFPLENSIFYKWTVTGNEESGDKMAS